MNKPTKIRLTDQGPEELARFLAQNGFKPFRARQVWQWIYKKRAGSFKGMKNLPEDLLTFLQKNCLPFPSLKRTERLVSPGDQTEKFLFQLADGNHIESVLIRAPGRNTACISSQVGCALGCTFCASARAGFIRNLSAGEIVEQVLHIIRSLPKNQELDNIVYMGIGEPLLNYDNVIKSIRTLNDRNGLDIGIRRITISTSGIIPGIKKLAKEKNPPRLSVSIHSANNEKRSNLLPINNKYGLYDLKGEIKTYAAAVKKQVGIEYILIKGINDSVADARALARLFKGIPCSFNLIPCNPTEDSEYQPPPPDRQKAFRAILAEKGFRATLRVRKGADINAACGQLRLKTIKS